MTKEEAIAKTMQLNILLEGKAKEDYSPALKIVLSTLKEKDKYIKDANDITTEMSKDIKKLISEIKKKDKEINSKNGTINALQSALEERTEERDRKDDIIAKQNKQIEKKDKIIYEIANNILQFRADTIMPQTVEEIVKYFERRVENVKN